LAVRVRLSSPLSWSVRLPERPVIVPFSPRIGESVSDTLIFFPSLRRRTVS